MPEKLTIATTEGTPNSLSLKVEIKTTDTAEKRSITALVDSRATGKFIDRQYAKSCQFDLIKLTQPILVYNVDGFCKGPKDTQRLQDSRVRTGQPLKLICDYNGATNAEARGR